GRLADQMAEVGKAAGKGFKIEADKLTDADRKLARDLRERFDPVEGIKRQADDLRKLWGKGGFGSLFNPFNLQQANDQFALAMADLFSKFNKENAYQPVGIATQGSSEAIAAWIQAQNVGIAGREKVEDRLLEAIQAQRRMQQEKLSEAIRLLELIEKKELPVF